MRHAVFSLSLTAALFTGCDVRPAPHAYPDHVVAPQEWRTTEAPAFEGEGIEHVIGWEIGGAACPSGVQLSPEGDLLTFGAWHTVVTVDVNQPDQQFDWGFTGHEYVAANAVVDGRPTALVTGYYGVGDAAHLLHTDVTGDVQTLEADGTLHFAGLGAGGAALVTSRDGSGPGCALSNAAGTTRLPREACTFSGQIASVSPTLNFVGSSGGLWRVTPEETRALPYETVMLAWQPNTESIVATDRSTGVTRIIGLDREGNLRWTRESLVSPTAIVALADGRVAVMDNDYTRARVRFLNAETGAIDRAPMHVEGWTSGFTAAADGRTFAMLVNENAHIFRLVD